MLTYTYEGYKYEPNGIAAARKAALAVIRTHKRPKSHEL